MKRRALIAFCAANAAIAAVYAMAFLPGGAPDGAAWLFAIAIATVLVAMMVIGADRHGIGRLWIPFAAAWLILAGGFALALLLPAETVATPLLLGLPRRAAVIMYVIGLGPAFIVPVAYAFTFERQTLSAHDLERVRAARAANGHPPRDAAPAGAGGEPAAARARGRA